MEDKKDFILRVVSPSFDSKLTDTLIELNHLRRLQLQGSTAPWIFFELKNIFQIFESVGSTRIEGNRTTISEYIEMKIERQERSNDRFSEIANVELAMTYIEDNVEAGVEITHQFIRELHHIVVDGLIEEGDKTPGVYRTWNVEIHKSQHIPPDHIHVQGQMDQLLALINKKDLDKYDLSKTAVAHHGFTWIHPFSNGNGRVVRLIAYALLIKYGFNVKDGKILNPTAIFCSDRDRYYEMLAEADKGHGKALLNWCDYVLQGILEEVTKVNKLLDFDFLHKRILVPTINLGIQRGYLSKGEAKVLALGIQKQKFKAKELDDAIEGLSSRQRTRLICKMKQAGFIRPIKDGGRIYCVTFMNNYLMRSLVQILEHENFIPPISH
jgi:Fic family protein